MRVFVSAIKWLVCEFNFDLLVIFYLFFRLVNLSIIQIRQLAAFFTGQLRVLLA